MRGLCWRYKLETVSTQLVFKAVGLAEITKRVNVDEGKETIRRVGRKGGASKGSTEELVRRGRNQAWHPQRRA